MQQYELSTLPTGERVISEHVPRVRSVSLGFWIGAGSRDETDARAGVSHFIEHLLFKGSSTHSAQEIAEIFDGLGGELNAATSRETTLVYARVPDDRLEPALDVIAGWSTSRPSPRSTPSARSCSRRSRWSRTTRRTSSTTSSPRRSSAATRLVGR